MIIPVFDIFVAHDDNSTNINNHILPALYVALSDEHIRHGSSRLLRHSSTVSGYADSDSNQTRAIVVEHVPNFSLEKHFNRN